MTAANLLKRLAPVSLALSVTIGSVACQTVQSETRSDVLGSDLIETGSDGEMGVRMLSERRDNQAVVLFTTSNCLQGMPYFTKPGEIVKIGPGEKATFISIYDKPDRVALAPYDEEVAAKILSYYPVQRKRGCEAVQK